MWSALGKLIILPFLTNSKFGPKMFKIQPFTRRKAQTQLLVLQECPKHHQTYNRVQPKWYSACWPNFWSLWHSWRPRKRPILTPKYPLCPCEGPQMSQTDQNCPASPEKTTDHLCSIRGKLVSSHDVFSRINMMMMMMMIHSECDSKITAVACPYGIGEFGVWSRKSKC